MRVTKKILLVLISFMFVGCVTTQQASNAPENSPPVLPIVNQNDEKPKEVKEILGIGVNELVNEREYFNPVPIPNYYYGQLLIDTIITSAAVEGPDARSLMNYVISIFGSEKNQFGLSVTPNLNGIDLPEFVVFSYIYDSDKNSWKSDLTRKYRSPAIPLNDFSKLNFKFKYISSNDKSVKVVEAISDIVSSYGGISPGSWVISKFSSPKVKEAAAAVDSIISKVLSNSIETSVNNSIEPVSDGSRRVVYSIETTKNQKLARIEFSARLFTSLVSGRVLQNHSVPSNYQDAIPKVDPFTNPLNRIKTSGGSDTTIGEELAKTGLLRELTNTNDPDTFRNKCRETLDFLAGEHGLNVFDKLNSFRNALALTKFVKDESLYNSGCLTSQEFDLLEKMGVPIKYEKPAMSTQLNDESLLKLAGYFKSPIANHGFERDVLNLFTETVRVASGIENFPAFPDEVALIERQNLLNRFKLLNAATVCCWGGPVYKGSGEPLPNAKPLFFRTLVSKDLYTIELYQSGVNKPVDFILLRPLRKNEVSEWKMGLLMQPAKPTVEGYQSDILLDRTQ